MTDDKLLVTEAYHNGVLVSETVPLQDYVELNSKFSIAIETLRRIVRERIDTSTDGGVLFIQSALLRIEGLKLLEIVADHYTGERTIKVPK
jgi:hypothetical protein